MAGISILFLTAVIALFVWALARFLRTPKDDRARTERGDLAVLLFLIPLGVGGSAARDRFPVNSHQYWLSNAVLIPICLIAIWYISKLVRTYRGLPPPQPKSSPTIHRSPRLDPPGRSRDHK